MSKSPSLRRIQADIRELALDPSDRYHAAPMENDMFEWYVVCRLGSFGRSVGRRKKAGRECCWCAVISQQLRRRSYETARRGVDRRSSISHSSLFEEPATATATTTTTATPREGLCIHTIPRIPSLLDPSSSSHAHPHHHPPLQAFYHSRCRSDGLCRGCVPWTYLVATGVSVQTTPHYFPNTDGTI